MVGGCLSEEVLLGNSLIHCFTAVLFPAASITELRFTPPTPPPSFALLCPPARPPKYIHFPSAEEKEYVAGNFEKISGFPNTIGCIDGTSIPLITLANKVKSTYTNRHNGTSIPLITLANKVKSTYTNRHNVALKCTILVF
ncbi:hypothetical protein QE152_g10309 [Popillia japonica]|uniref:DDE Tnp4 domain-containing protein n=1 Tax=Popillia japonica TaxID=7064 RepID=A0AAW1LV91_POPJA